MNNNTTSADEAGLYGINTGNSSRNNAEMWGKNCFNSAFPTALACYMRDNDKKMVYINISDNTDSLQIQNTDIHINNVFNSTLPNNKLRFLFEQKYQPYNQYDNAGNELDNADLVIQNENGEWLRQFQIKLTVLPDNNTSQKEPDKWAPELVIRPADTSLCALGMFHQIVEEEETSGTDKIKNLFDDICYGLIWETLPENADKQKAMIDKALKFIEIFRQYQKPYLLHPIWKTEGKSPNLASDNALDIFTWSDYAFILACINKGKNEKGDATRGFRAVARFVRAMHDLSVRGNTRLHNIYRQMDFGKQTDKEVALSGLETQKYMISPRRTKPLLPPEVLAKVILNNGHKHLSPERRFDQTVYFTADMIFKNHHARTAEQ